VSRAVFVDGNGNVRIDNSRERNLRLTFASPAVDRGVG
jgi:hypothetical protein